MDSAAAEDVFIAPVMTEWVGEESEESVKNELMPPDLPAKATRSQDTEKVSSYLSLLPLRYHKV